MLHEQKYNQMKVFLSEPLEYDAYSNCDQDLREIVIIALRF